MRRQGLQGESDRRGKTDQPGRLDIHVHAAIGGLSCIGAIRDALVGHEHDVAVALEDICYDAAVTV
jgi:hypothetical protein